MGKQDDIIRRVSGRVEFEIPKRSRAGLGGLDGGSIVFSVEFRDVNGDQEIEAPANARPLSDLTDSLGAGGLPGGLGGGGEEPEVPVPPDMPSGGSDGDSTTRRRSGATPTALTRRGPRTPRSCSAAPSSSRSPDQPTLTLLRRSRSGSMRQRRASSTCSGASSQRSGWSSPS